MAKTIEQQIAELDARRAELKKRQRERDKRERARTDAELLRAVKDCFGDGITAERIRAKYGKPEQAAKQDKPKEANPSKGLGSAEAVAAAMKAPAASREAKQ